MSSLENADQTYHSFLETAFARHYMDGTDVWTQDQTLVSVASFLRGFLPSKGNLLDVGAGRGRDAAYFLKHGFKVVAVDPFETPEIRELASTQNLTFVKGFAQDFRSETKFDGVLDNGSFHHQDPADYQDYLTRVFASLKAGGHFVISTYTPFDEGQPGRDGRMKDGRRGRSFSAEELRLQVEKAGFEFVESRRMLQQNGSAYYLAACFKKPIVARVLLMTPLAKAVQAAAELGLHTTSVWHTGEKTGSLVATIKDVERDSNAFFQIDLENSSELQSLITQLRTQKFTEGIYNGPDHYMSAALTIFSELGLQRSSPEVFRLMHRKDRLREHLRQAELSPVRVMAVDGELQLRQAVEQIGLPIILKPVDGGGSKNIHLLQNDSDVGRIIRTSLNLAGKNSRWIAEEYLTGIQISVEAMTYGVGDHVIMGITEKFEVAPPHFVENGGVFPARLSHAVARAAADLTTAMLTSVGYAFGASHTELMITPQGPRIIETHARAAGLIPFLMEAANGVCMHKTLLGAVTGRRMSPTKDDIGLLSFMSFEVGRTIKSIAGRQELSEHPYVKKHNVWVAVGQVVPEITYNDLRHGYIVTFGRTLEDAQTHASQALALLRIEYEDSAGRSEAN